MTRAVVATAIFVACLLPFGCDWADDMCLRRPDAAECQEDSP